MSADPLDKQLVEAVLSRPRRGKADLEEAKLAGLRPSRPKPGATDDDDDDDEDLDLGENESEDGEKTVVISAAGVTGVPVKSPTDAPGQDRRQDRRRADRGGARRDLRRHDRDRRPGPDVPQGDRQGRPADRRGRGRPGQGDRARRADGRGALDGHLLAPRVDPARHRAQDPDHQDPAPTAVRRRGARPHPPRAVRSGCQRPAGPDAGLPPGQGRARRPVGRDQGAPQGGEEAGPRLQRGARSRDVHRVDGLVVPGRPQRRSRLARQRRAAGDLGLDAR